MTKRRKTKIERKEESIRLRMTTEQKEAFTKAAERAALDLSSWIRSTCTEAARASASAEAKS